MLVNELIDDSVSQLVVRETDRLLEILCRKLQITDTQYNKAKEHYEAIGKLLDASDSPLAIYKPHIYPQGSLRISTTVKPIHQEEYDLDLVCEFQALNWREISEPVRLLDEIEKLLKADSTYASMIEHKNRCIRIVYKDDFHLDILPACPDKELGHGCLLVPDRKAANWKPSNPSGFASWFDTQASKRIQIATESVQPFVQRVRMESHPTLKRVVQLMKRRRDVAFANNRENAPISIVLTTLAAQHHQYHTSVIHAFTDILDGIVESLPTNGDRLYVLNPANPSEDLSERWNSDRKGYDMFANWITGLRQEWRGTHGKNGKVLNNQFKALFGETVVTGAYIDLFNDDSSQINDDRERKNLQMHMGTGILASSLTTGVMPVQKGTTFYGE